MRSLDYYTYFLLILGKDHTNGPTPLHTCVIVAIKCVTIVAAAGASVSSSLISTISLSQNGLWLLLDENIAWKLLVTITYV